MPAQGASKWKAPPAPPPRQPAASAPPLRPPSPGYAAQLPPPPSPGYAVAAAFTAHNPCA
ncbi:hypothetical protein E2562_002028 [Oryza meyeriana var. granulata]|uniref:Uncharacterized protein n=1 Tax=Oryza meyeriana var. granulata TaxID=110450 RepID=A0A6G1C3K1_9ORYZ|nr:hypothetical protein E2562_002028 [Oryza meyeriana var. granulata]